MEKYIIILVILATIYYIQTQLKNAEEFEDAAAKDKADAPKDKADKADAPKEKVQVSNQSAGSGIDDANAINTLAQISKQLMAGGVTVPGNMTIQGNLNIIGPMQISNAATNFITINKTAVVDKDSMQLWNSASQLILVGRKDDNSDYSWPGVVLDSKKSNIITNTLTVNGDINFPNKTTIRGAGRLHMTSGEDLYLHPKTGVRIGKHESGSGGLVVEGSITINESFMLMAPIYRKHMPAGYYYIRAHGNSVPIYYGLNIFWRDDNTHAIKMNTMAKYGWPESIYHNTGLDMRWTPDANWCARHLVVFPGYKVRLYNWGNPLVDRIGLKAAGEHPFGDSGNSIHVGFVAFAEEGDPPGEINW